MFVSSCGAAWGKVLAHQAYCAQGLLRDSPLCGGISQPVRETAEPSRRVAFNPVNE